MGLEQPNSGHHGDFVIYEDEFWAGAFEAIDQNIDLLNAGSRDALRVVTTRSRGDFQKESVIDDDAGIVDRRVHTGTTQPTVGVEDRPMTQLELVRPKLNRKIGPIGQTLDAWKKISSDTSEMSFIVGQMVGAKIVQNYVNTGLYALVGALENSGASLTVDKHAVTGGSAAVSDHLRESLALMGDASENIVVWVMHSTTYFKLMQEQGAPGGTTHGFSALDRVAGAVLVEGSIATYGRPVVVTDSPALTLATPAGFSTLGLTRNACVMMESEERELVSQVITGHENLIFRIQGEYAFNCGVKGISYTDSGVNPADTALATAGNWTSVLYDKQCAGVLLKNNTTDS
jgi:hypothetical protein